MRVCVESSGAQFAINLMGADVHACYRCAMQIHRRAFVLCYAVLFSRRRSTFAPLKAHKCVCDALRMFFSFSARKFT